MTQEVAQALARCESCNKAYRIPDPDRAFKCKTCGGIVRAVDPAPDHHDPFGGTATCSECQAINPGHAVVCVQCGTALPTTQSNAEAAQLRHEATHALKRAYRFIGGVTWFYRIGALAYAIATLFAILALKQTEIPVRPGVLVVCLTTLMSLLMLMGAMHILFRPFVWTVLIGSLATVVSLVHLIGPNPFDLAFFGSAAWAVFAWAAVVPSLRFEKLIAEHKDLYVLHHASRRTRVSLAGHSAEERHERLMSAMRRAAMRAWKVSALAGGLLCIASATGTYMIVSDQRPEDFHLVLAEFEKSWNDQGLADASRFFDPLVREQQALWLGGVTAGHGWKENWPRLENGEPRGGPKDVWIDYGVGDLTLSANWFLDGQEWSLLRIDLPIPPLEDCLERFRQAWHASDPEGMVVFFSEENRGAMLESIGEAASRRGWSTFPEIRETQIGDLSRADTGVSMALDKGALTTRWHFRANGTWGMHALKWPKR